VLCSVHAGVKVFLSGERGGNGRGNITPWVGGGANLSPDGAMRAHFVSHAFGIAPARGTEAGHVATPSAETGDKVILSA